MQNGRERMPWQGRSPGGRYERGLRGTPRPADGCMSRGYETYCLADPLFYEAPEVVAKPENDFAVSRSPAPAGWRRVDLDDWVVMVAEGCAIPPQGWKIHVAACLDNAEEVLGAVWEYCIPRRIQFKFVRSPDLFFLRNIKY